MTQLCWTLSGTASTTQMKVVINKDKQSYDAFLEIIKPTELAEPTRFTLVLDQEVWSLHFNGTEVQSVSQSQLDNRKVYL